MVCCSGSETSGSLRVLENGFDYREASFLPYPLLKNVWSVGYVNA